MTWITNHVMDIFYFFLEILEMKPKLAAETAFVGTTQPVWFTLYMTDAQTAGKHLLSCMQAKVLPL